MPSIIDFTHLSRTGVVIHSVRNKVIHKNYVFFVTFRSRTFRFGRNKALVLTNKQKQFCKKLLFLRDTRVKCFLLNIENRQHQDIQIFETILTSLLVSIKTSSMIAQL